MQHMDSEQTEIRQQLTKFINLLQTDYNSSQNVSGQHRSFNQYSLSKKLSIILSASQPQSSSLDKQNSNPSANRSFSSNEKELNSISGNEAIKLLLNSKLNNAQVVLVEKIKEYIETLKKEAEAHQISAKQAKKQLGSQRKVNDQMLAVLMKLDQQQKQLWVKYNATVAKLQQMTERNKNIDGQFQMMRETLHKLQNDNDFMKKLIFHANQNYQALEKRCKYLESNQERQISTDRTRLRNGSSDLLLKSVKTKKNSHSPTYSEINNSPRGNHFQDIYRKMIVRTLKSKGKAKH